MTYSEIHRRIKNILDKEMRLFQISHSYTANFYDDLGMSLWELNLLLYKVENHFGIELENGLEEKLNTINQLVTLIHYEHHKKLAKAVA
ncbi:MAG: acyl carrier protein [Bacteroidota bacterium]